MIVKRKNRYGVRVYRGGRQVWIGTYGKLKEARVAERKALVTSGATHDESCASFASRWVDDFPRKRASTNRTNRYAVKPFGEEFGTAPMSSITRKQARHWGLRHPSKVSAVRAMFADALDEEVVATNPFSKLRLPQSRARRDIETLTESQLNQLADAALELPGMPGPTMRCMVLFAAYVGLRPAEMYVLRWTDVDFANGRVHIKHSLGSTGEVTTPKNGRARTVVLPPPAADALRALPRRTDSAYVFVTSKGTHYTKTTQYYHWRQLRLLAGMPKMEFYELRHFCATQLLELGVSHANVAIQLGHTDGGALVMSTYGHPSEALALENVAMAYERGQAKLRAV